MSAFVARDTEGVRLKLDQEDLRVCEGAAPYEIADLPTSMMFLATSGCYTVCCLHGRGEDCGRGLRGGRSKEPNLRLTFGYYAVELEYEEGGSFEIELPAIHELPWPIIRPGDPSGPELRAAHAISERIISLRDTAGLDVCTARRQLRIPRLVRRFINRHTMTLIEQFIEEHDDAQDHHNGAPGRQGDEGLLSVRLSDGRRGRADALHPEGELR